MSTPWHRNNITVYEVPERERVYRRGRCGGVPVLIRIVTEQDLLGAQCQVIDPDLINNTIEVATISLVLPENDRRIG